MLDDRFIAHVKPCLLLDGGAQQAANMFRGIHASPPRRHIKQFPNRVGADSKSVDIPLQHLILNGSSFG